MSITIQYFIKVEDADVEKYLKLFTLLSLSDITHIMQTHILNPEKRSAQRRLAAEVTEMVHLRTPPSSLKIMNLFLTSRHQRLGSNVPKLSPLSSLIRTPRTSKLPTSCLHSTETHVLP